MGTRSQIVVKNTEGKQYVSMYGQYDGYPSGKGADLVAFIKSGEFVNGLSVTSAVEGSAPPVQFNGLGCFAAQMVCALKKGKAGGVYLEPHDTPICQQDYTYEVVVNENAYLTGEQRARKLVGVIVHCFDERIFFGPFDEFEAFVDADE